MKRIQRVAALLVITALMVVIAVTAGAPAAFGEAKAIAEPNLIDAHAGKAEAHIGE